MPQSIRRLSRHRARRALTQTPPPPSASQVSNPLPVAVDLYWAAPGTSNPLQYLLTILPNTTVSLPAAPGTGQQILAIFDATGAALTYTGSYTSGYTLSFNPPNAQPLPSGSIALPPDSSPVLVGAGLNVVGLLVTREQYWTRSPESYSLAPNETRTSSFTQTTGVTSDSSSMETVSQTLSTSASIGWGPVSASLSASLDASSTVQHQLTLSDQTTTSSVVEVTAGDDPVLVIYWQLVDRVMFWSTGAYDSTAIAVMMDEDTDIPDALANSTTLLPKASLLIAQEPVVPVVSTALDFAAGVRRDRRLRSKSRRHTRNGGKS